MEERSRKTLLRIKLQLQKIMAVQEEGVLHSKRAKMAQEVAGINMVVKNRTSDPSSRKYKLRGKLWKQKQERMVKRCTCRQIGVRLKRTF